MTGIGAYDIPTRDKIPVLQKLFSSQKEGFALDVGSGIGFTAAAVLGRQPLVCLDLHAANLMYFLDRVAPRSGEGKAYGLRADVNRLPFREGVFRKILCSEVLEHLEDDDSAVRELARVLAPGGKLVITVPYTGLGFTSFLEMMRIKTVHDRPGPERHVRRGYDEKSMGTLLSRHGLKIESHTYYLRFFSRLATDLVSLIHLAYQKVRHGRHSWQWSDVAASENEGVLKLYKLVFPALWVFTRLDRCLAGCRGFGLVVCARKR